MRCLIWCTGHTKHNLQLCQHDRPSVTALLALPFRFRCQTASDAAAFPASMNGFTISADTEQIEVVDVAITGGGGIGIAASVPAKSFLVGAFPVFSAR